MRTSQEYLAKLRTMRPNVYMGGGLVARDDPRIMPGVNVIGLTMDVAADPEYDGVVTATSHLSGQKINRFTHIHRSTEDLLMKQKMTRLLCQRTGGCIQRCMGVDALNAVSVVAHEIDQASGTTHYYENFLKYLAYFQENDLVAACAQTDVKGDRSKRPFEQQDPDVYVHVVEKNADGIVVRGAKNHITISPYADEIIAVPTRALTKDDAPWAVSFAVPADHPNMHLVTRATSPRPRNRLKAPIAELGWSDSFVIFDNAFVPWERVFMCGEWQLGGRLASLFASYHRHSYCGCKPATTDIIMGATALVADYNGVGSAPHIREEIADLIAVAELVYSAGVAASVTGKPSSSGTYIPDIVYTNVGRYHAGINIYHEHETLAAIAGGLPATIPPEDDFYSAETGALMNKYIMRKPGVSAENQHRIFRMISDMIASAMGGCNQFAGIHGGGSPIMEKIAIRSQYDIESKKQLAKYLAGIVEDEAKPAEAAKVAARR